MASRPVYRGSCRMEETKVPFHPVKRPFCRMGMLLIAKVQAQASRPIELGAAHFSNMYSMFMTLFHFL